MAASSATLTPMMQQYYELKKKAKGAIMLFRMGDFYEIFGDDALEVAPKLEIALTSRDKGGKEKIPFCGVPHHSAKNYWLKLIKLGYRVAIADQVEDPKDAKGIVRREIVRFITPGSIDELEGLENDQANYIMAIYEDPTKHRWSVSLCDVSTGEFRCGPLKDFNQLASVIDHFRPRELLCRRFLKDELKEDLANIIQAHNLNIEELPESPIRSSADQNSLLKKAGLDHQLKKHPCGNVTGGKEVCAALLKYLVDLQVNTSQFMTIRPLFEEQRMLLDETARRDLELFESSARRQAAGSFYREINYCLSPMGARLLRSHLAQPFTDAGQISSIQESIEFLYAKPEDLEALRALLRRIPDLERLATRLLAKVSAPSELTQIRDSLQKAQQIADHFSDRVPALLSQSLKDLRLAAEPLTLLEQTMSDEPSNLGAGNLVFRSGIDPSLDELNQLSENGYQSVAAYEQKLREQTQITNLKIKSHKTFGLLIEVTKSHLAKVPASFIRRQTMVNNERFITPELTKLDQTLASAKSDAIQREAVLYGEFLEALSKFHERLQSISAALGSVDLLQSHAKHAAERQLCRPTVGERIELKGSRHLVVESFVGKHHFAPNHILIEPERKQVLITGPNMAGKSTVMRQIALSAILHQMGSFVPATYAQLPIFDRVFTRVGASDDLSQGKSTFLVEMSEAAQILRLATPKSLVILDEVGRGTSTSDGLAIASAILEELATNLHCHAFFATHYHELVPFAESLQGVRIMQTQVQEHEGSIKFSHRLIDGASGNSYGIEVAKIAGIPERIISRANAFLAKQEENEQFTPQKRIVSDWIPEEKVPADFVPNRLKELSDSIRNIRIHRTTPLQALNILNELKATLGDAEQPSLFD